MRALGTLSFASLMMMLSVAGCATASGGNEPDAGGDDVVDARVVDAALDKDGAPVDAAPAVDAQGIDAAAPDAQLVDAQMIDARLPDAQMLDAAVPDAMAPDAAPMCVPPVAGPCDTAPQCGCSGTQNCVVIDNTSGNTGCITAGATTPYRSCTTNSQCARGNSCFGGLCTPYCAGSADCPGAYRQCKQAYYEDAGGATLPTPGFLYCTLTCDPVNPQLDDATYDACGPGLKCLPSNDRASDCYNLGSGSGTQDAFCGITSADDSLCAPGYLCTSPIGFGFACAKFCVVGGTGCPSGTTCSGFSTAQFAGPNTIGICQ